MGLTARALQKETMLPFWSDWSVFSGTGDTTLTTHTPGKVKIFGRAEEPLDRRLEDVRP